MPNFTSTSANLKPRGPGDVKTQAYAQWVVIDLNNFSGNKVVVVKNVHLDWGKFYKGDNKDNEISASAIENTKISPGGEFTISSCGREDAASGTEGNFDVYEDGPGGKLVSHFYWDCPWGRKTNTWTIDGAPPTWVVGSSGANLDSGALGTITVQMINRA